MATGRPDFTAVIHELRREYGSPQPPKVTDPFEMILWENVAYLLSDERREAAFRELARRVGTRPERILAARRPTLLLVARMGGMRPEDRAEKLLRIAEIALDEFGGDVDAALGPPLSRAKKALQKFPGIGEPGAEKILLFSRRFPILALDSNGLRVLQRLGFGAEKKNYAATYRSVREALEGQAPADFDRLVDAHQLLRQHGRTLCRSSGPQCRACPVAHLCKYYSENVR